MSDIKKRKKAREKKRKKTMRIVFAAAAIVIIGAIVIGVKSCGGQKNQNPEVQVTSTETPSGTDRPTAMHPHRIFFSAAPCLVLPL